MFPKKIHFVSTNEKAILTRVAFTPSKIKMGYYKYTQSKTKIGLTHPFGEEQMNDFLTKGIIKEEATD